MSKFQPSRMDDLCRFGPEEEPPSWNRDRVRAAAETANKLFGQWMPQRWLDLFMDAYENISSAK